jgi:UDP-glucose 4-epimerase
MTKVLVTGGAGYIGSVVTEALLAAGFDVVVFDDLSQGHRGAVPLDVPFVEGSLLDAEAVERVFGEHPGLDGVLHFASRSLVGESMQRPELYLGDNVAAGLNLLTAAARHGVGRFVLSSTANLFGDPRRIPIDEDEEIKPGSPYGESKCWLERTLGWFERLYGLRYAALRYFNAAGASVERGEDHHPETHLIPLLLDVARGERDGFTLFGDDYPTPDGTCVRDYVHVLDLAQAHLLAFAALDHGSRVYNLGNGRGFSNREVIEAARRVTGQPIPFEVGPRRAGDPAVLVASSERIRHELGWQPAYPGLEDIVASAWEWRQRHPRGHTDG